VSGPVTLVSMLLSSVSISAAANNRAFGRRADAEIEDRRRRATDGLADALDDVRGRLRREHRQDGDVQRAPASRTVRTRVSALRRMRW
jgi:hypothetical protein